MHCDRFCTLPSLRLASRTLRELAILLPTVVGCGDDGEGTGDSSSSDPTATGSASATGSDSGSATASASGATTDGGTLGDASSSSVGDDATTSGPADSSSGGETSTVECRLLVVEVLYNVEGGDDLLQWVKLYNRCDESIDLAGLSIGYSSLAWGDGFKELVGTVDPFGCYIVGGPDSSALNGDPDYMLADDYAPNLDTAEVTGAAVGLFDVPTDQIPGATPIDAVIYGPNNDNGLIDSNGRVVAPHVGNAPENGSIQRTSEDDTWIIADVPTPGACPPF
jgi:hypothetical protein